MNHHTIIVCGIDYRGINMGNPINKAREIAISIFPYVSPLSPETMNGYQSFFIPPDGSKEDWDESEVGDDQRDKFIEQLKLMEYEDGSSPICWVEVQFGDDNNISSIIRHG
jgi:hypothetical protein